MSSAQYLRQGLVVGSCEIWCDLMHLLESNGLTGMRLYASIHKFYSIFEGSTLKKTWIINISKLGSV